MVKFVVGKYQNVFQVENSPVTLILRVIFAYGVLILRKVEPWRGCLEVVISGVTSKASME